MRFKIREITKEKGQTIEGLARVTGLGISTIRNIASNRTTNPSIQTLTKLAEALGVSREDLIVDEKSDPLSPPKV